MAKAFIGLHHDFSLTQLSLTCNVDSNVSFQQVNTLKDSNKDLDPKSPITTTDKKLPPYGTSLEISDLNILRSKQEIAAGAQV